jgi:Domain of unknown function (DUF4126)
MELGMPLGLGFASGLNAYLPLLSFVAAVRWLHWYRMNPNFTFLTSDWCIVALIALTFVDFIIDKFPVIDHTWDAAHTVIRPLAGGLIAAASSNAVTIPIQLGAVSSYSLSIVHVVSGNIHLVGAGLLIIAGCGGILAAMSHAAKATTRLVSTLTTAGLLNALLSLGEDILVVMAILLALLLPAIMLIVIVLFLLVFGRSILFFWSRRLSG